MLDEPFNHFLHILPVHGGDICPVHPSLDACLLFLLLKTLKSGLKACKRFLLEWLCLGVEFEIEEVDFGADEEDFRGFWVESLFDDGVPLGNGLFEWIWLAGVEENDDAVGVLGLEFGDWVSDFLKRKQNHMGSDLGLYKNNMHSG